MKVTQPVHLLPRWFKPGSAGAGAPRWRAHAAVLLLGQTRGGSARSVALATRSLYGRIVVRARGGTRLRTCITADHLGILAGVLRVLQGRFHRRVDLVIAFLAGGRL